MSQETEVTLLAALAFAEPVDAPVLAALDAVVAETRREPGCLDYAAHVHAEDPRRVLFYERWADQGALDRHWASEHLAVFREFAAPRLSVPTELGFWRRLP